MPPDDHFEALRTYPAEDLKKLFKLALNVLRKPKPVDKPARKDDIAKTIAGMISGESGLAAVYQSLSGIEKSVIQEMVHNTGGVFDRDKIAARYGRLPGRADKEHQDDGYFVNTYHGGKSFGPLNLLLSQQDTLADELIKRLKEIAPVPDKASVKSLKELPSFIERPGNAFRNRNRPSEMKLEIHRTGKAALNDAQAVLRLLEHSAVGVGGKTGRVSKAGAEKIRKILYCGDFYSQEEESVPNDEVKMKAAGIRPFAWPLLLQAGKLARVQGAALKLTEKGKKALNEEPQKILEKLWTAWLGTDIFHEMSRVEVIKGQRSRGRPLYRASEGRISIADALSELPAGRWIEIEDFFKFLIGGGHQFEIARSPWALYICDREYGSLGYSHVNWGYINGRFARAFLLEYAAVLGVIDVALVPPWAAVVDYLELWGTDMCSCLSRYDGLKYIRVNSLGAWLLGIESKYEPEESETGSGFRITPNLEIALLSESILPADRLFLERICDNISGSAWKISRSRILASVEKGLTVEKIREYLARINAGELPGEVERFLADIKERTGKVRFAGKCILVDCSDDFTAELIANDSSLGKLCIRAGNSLVIKREEEKTFRRLLKKAGYVIPPD